MKRLEYELGEISGHGYAPLFLLVADIVGQAKKQNIPFSSRGMPMLNRTDWFNPTRMPATPAMAAATTTVDIRILLTGMPTIDAMLPSSETARMAKPRRVRPMPK